MMKDISRRDFVKTVVIGGASLSLGSAMFHKPLEALASGKFDIGQCKSVRIKCVSELGWKDTKNLLTTLKGGGGPKESQWEKPWDPSNAAGSCLSSGPFRRVIKVVSQDDPANLRSDIKGWCQDRCWKRSLCGGWGEPHLSRRRRLRGERSICRQGGQGCR